MAHSPLDKIQALGLIEKEIIMCLQSAGKKLSFTQTSTSSHSSFPISGSALSELSKEKSSQKSAENHTQQFLKSLSNVESKLSEQINYLTQVSTGQPHEGSGYASQKVLQMAWHRNHNASSRIKELEDLKARYMQATTQRQPLNRPLAPAPSAGQTNGQNQNQPTTTSN